ncbi:glycosyltransferase family 4 protein [Microbacterium oleivorans]|uniref:GDP-mannose-dependent alpha-(1-2)-phosphatidylinositol mannosyltransferase n=1 Tax=Microbacterium oleivorans TaxID=273677 RepID=A0A031FWR1_9MICO|nr:glycosyltransferase family 4 protein [Microbacterium oleivorans]EZP29038.1 GDP-mannose-dependent alpha-(1-2)-phosphatidylinositol mannosyltransferase [Microbacterium oleivorans]
MPESTRANRSKHARYYRGARTAHLERLEAQHPGDFLYNKTLYDFDISKAPSGTRVRRVGIGTVLVSILKREYDVLEIVEPYAPSALPQNLLISLVWRVSRIGGRTPTKLVTYAIENADLPEKFSQQFHLPLSLTQILLRRAVLFSYRSLERIVFGTQDAAQNYQSLLGASFDNRPKPERRTILGLSSPRPTTDAGSTQPTVIFVGALDDRKGVTLLLDAWPAVAARGLDAQLIVMGKGPKEDEVRSAVADLDNVHFTVDPPRSAIWEALDRSDALVLLSQPYPGWKEQIGLPIVEGLSAGLEIVASTETGVADWLSTHGHRVVPPNSSLSELADAIHAALAHRRSRAEIKGALPQRDGRLEADDWLHQ